MSKLKHNKIYMVGAGGVSMSGIAAILKNFNYIVNGYDDNQSANTDKLNNMGIHVTIGQIDEQDLKSSDLVVYSAAISPDHPCMQLAKHFNIETMERANFLGLITKHFSDTICIAGTHGKTTTTSMVSLCFLEDNKDPSIQVGAYLKDIDGNYRVGNSNYFIIESCEYHESFLKFFPKAEIILNIDDDHLDYYYNLNNIKKAFCNFANLLPDDGVLIYNNDDKNSKILEDINVKKISFGIENNSDFMAKNIKFNDGFASFDVIDNTNNQNKTLGKIKLSVPGLHNVYNALSCIGVCLYYNVSFEAIQKGLNKFLGASRRFEYKGQVNGANIYDDYAHHPTEIKATAKAMKQKKYNKSFVIFQPHTYSRTIEHLDEFANALLDFDDIILLDIYAAREKDPGNVSSTLILDKLKQMGKDAKYMPDFADVENYIKSNAKMGDIVITLGAGTVTKLSDALAK